MNEDEFNQDNSAVKSQELLKNIKNVELLQTNLTSTKIDADSENADESTDLTENKRKPLILIMTEYIKQLKNEIIDLEDDLHEKHAAEMKSRHNYWAEQSKNKKIEEQLVAEKEKIKELGKKEIVLTKSNKELTERIRSLQDRLDKRSTSENTTRQEGIETTTRSLSQQIEIVEQLDEVRKPLKTEYIDNIHTLFNTVNSIEKRCSAMEANFQNIVTREERTTMESLSSRSSGTILYARVI